MKQIFFFATPPDIVPVLRRLESHVPLKFVEMGTFLTPNRPVHLQSSEIPNPGFATHETASLSKAYMVSYRDTKNHMQVSVTRKGERQWNLFGADNEESVVLNLAGIWKTGTLLPGSIVTTHENPISQLLMKWFLTAIKEEGFAKVKNWWLGKEALDMLRTGKRLTTTAEQSPPDFDLREE